MRIKWQIISEDKQDKSTKWRAEINSERFGKYAWIELIAFEINSVDDLRVIRGGWRVFAKEKYDEGTVEYSAIEVNHIFTT